MGLLVVFFPEESSPIAEKTKLFSSPCSASSSSSSSNSPSTIFRRISSNGIFSKAQSTISICTLLLLTTLLLFTLSTIEPTTHRQFPSQKSPAIHIPNNPIAKSKTNYFFPKLLRTKSYDNASKSENFPSPALQRMGTLYRRGTRAMNDLVVGHVVDDTTDDEFKLFLRVMHRSGLTARSDVVFIFSSASLSSRFAPIIQEENDSFFSLIHHYTQINLTHHKNPKQSHNFDVNKFFKVGKKGSEIGEPLWGKRIRSNLTNPETGNHTAEENDPLLSYGSILSFDPTELDPENSLAGFVDHVPLSLRRWACYPMLLGRVKRNFKNVMLVDVKNLVLVNDPLGRVRNRSPVSIFLYRNPESRFSSMQSKNNSEKPQSRPRVNSAILMGGARGIRRLSNAMLIEIVRAATQQDKKNSLSESMILSELVGNEFMLKSVNLITSTESIPDTISLADHNSASGTSLWDYVIIQRGISGRELNSFIEKQICTSGVDSSVYRDC